MCKNICLIPAREGSKRVRNKNIRLINGYPLISYPIKCSIKSKIFNRIVVSTDSEKIANISRKYGAEIPFLRSKNLSDDKTPILSVVKDTIKRLNLESKYEYICVIYATAANISHKDLIQALKKIKKDKTDLLISITDFEYSPLRAFKIDNKNYLKFNWKKYASKRSQDLPNLFRDAGQFFIYKISSINKTKRIIPKKTSFFKLERHKSIDIDNPGDLKLLRRLFSK
jgi:pseudaminic acid cytidylyltransferase